MVPLIQHNQVTFHLQFLPKDTTVLMDQAVHLVVVVVVVQVQQDLEQLVVLAQCQILMALDIIIQVAAQALGRTYISMVE
jgi:hypothetical protein